MAKSVLKWQLNRTVHRVVCVSNLVGFGIFSVGSSSALADIYHYNNVLVGDRANGMGGAYTGIADDASGTYYNPAGIAFAQSNDLSGSANAYYNKSQVYSKVVGNQDYEEQASGVFSPFIGILNKLDRFVPGLVGAFSMYTSDTELLNQDDRWPNTFAGAGTYVDGFHRTVQLKSNTSHISVALGYRLSGRLSVGVGLRHTTIDQLSQDFQKNTINIYKTVSGDLIRIYEQIFYKNERAMLRASAIEPALGVQMALGQAFSIGLTVRKGTVMSEAFESDIDSITTERENTDGLQQSDIPVIKLGSVEDLKESKPLASIPGEVRVGMAWFASPRLLLSGDISYYDPATSGKAVFFRRESVLNYALGTEYYITPSIALRAGAFTNNDSRKEIIAGKSGQLAHIDYSGGSLFLAYIQPNSQISFGAVVQQGSGKAQLNSQNLASLQNVKGSISTVSVAATTSL